VSGFGRYTSCLFRVRGSSIALMIIVASFSSTKYTVSKLEVRKLGIEIYVESFQSSVIPHMFSRKCFKEDSNQVQHKQWIPIP
jgi:hypothetical protein